MTSPINAAQVPPPPTSGQVMILITELNPDGEGWQEHCRELPANEQERTYRFRYAADRLRFAKCRLMLREVVACWQCVTKNEITFRFGKNGKPFLVQDHGLQFNISHTTGCAVLAFCHNHEIGIDIEMTRRNTDFEGVARKVFTRREQEMLMPLTKSEKRKLFFQLWTAKESLMKATGLGFSLNPSSVETFLPKYSGETGSFTSQNLPTANTFQVVEIPVSPGYQSMLCAPAPVMKKSPLTFTI